ncbi:MAG: hypothetical protein B6I35_09265 [Anaerolineaceae bacterium 4572_32.2]|nr:MAG: hypothetical protein B6I35_09265 [Anaerolineaceae bacterium 4572_32.2]
MNQSQKQALFANLVFNEEDEPAETIYIEGEPYYVILDSGFRRHVEAAYIDRQVTNVLRKQILSQRELVTEGILQMMGKDDLFTKALVDSSIENLDERVSEQGIPEEARAWLGMLGFKVVVDHHGDLVRLDMPSREIPPDE